MGISSFDGLALLSLSGRGQMGDEILCFGRPELFLTKQYLQQLVHGLSLSWTSDEIDRIVESKYGERFLERAGFRTIRCLDASQYEGADIVHDLNKPIPATLEGVTNFLYVNGTIEHVFDIGTALHNVTRLLRVGGTVLLTGPANGQCGHGFYQFSPELFYRFFEVNGYENARVYVIGRKHPHRWFHAKDPRQLKRRVEFMTMEPTEIIAIARKARDLSSLEIPQQSDYAQDLWQANLAEANTDKWSPKKWTLSSVFNNKVRFPFAVGLRYFAGTGMPVLDRHPAFEHIDPFSRPL